MFFYKGPTQLSAWSEKNPCYYIADLVLFLVLFLSLSPKYIKNKDKYRVSNKNTYGLNIEWDAT